MTLRWPVLATGALAVALGLGAWGLWGAAPEASDAGSARQEAGQAPAAAPSHQIVGAAAVLPTPGGGDPFFADDLELKLESLLIEAGEAATPEALKQRLGALVERHFAAAHRARALELARRYVDYRVALGSIKPPARPDDPRALRMAIDARQRAREIYFSPEEYQALFAQEDALDRFTVARLEIERNSELTPAQKKEALAEAERDELDDGQRLARREAVAHVGVAELTDRFEAQGVGPHERFQQRSAQFGDAAAQRMAQLDREEQSWQDRLSRYADARDARTDPVQLEQLREQLFSGQERDRVDAALALRAR